MASWPTWSTRRQLLVVAVAVLVALAAALGLLWPLTDVIAAHDVGLITGPLRAARLQTAREAVRTQLLTLGAGVFALGALVYTARNFSLSREGQVTDRYTRAIEQLGSYTIDVTIGGIYALERIAHDSPRDHPTVMEVLAACIREHSGEQWPRASKEPGAERPERATRPDVQAAITVIGRRDVAHDSRQIDLTKVNLTAANLGGAYLVDANLLGANFSRAFLAHANLARATLVGADFTKTDLTGANLTGANLPGSKLSGAYMPSANFSVAHLQRADLTRADLPGAVFSGAHLRGADLSGAKLIEVDLAGADLADSIMRQASLVDANLAGADLTNADLSTADLTRTNFTDANLTGAWFPAGAPVPAGWAVDQGTGRLGR
jgi:uncharacterized protein YjbI with pentapeptide repeats